MKMRTTVNAVVLLVLLLQVSSAWAESGRALSETALYYFFSTVAQTLAASFGILAVFLVFRLPGVEASFVAARDEFRNFTTRVAPEELLRVAQRGGWAAVAARLREMMPLIRRGT